MSVDDIEELIARTAMGDRKAFTKLYDSVSAKLLGVGIRVLKDRSAAEDALQDTFVKIWHKADSYSAGSMSPMSWLITIARNTAIDLLRARRETADIDDVADTLKSSEPSPESQVVAASEARRINTCLGELQGEHSDAVRGAYLMGESYADLAAKFDVPINTMRSWLRRSLISLRECLSR